MSWGALELWPEDAVTAFPATGGQEQRWFLLEAVAQGIELNGVQLATEF